MEELELRELFQIITKRIWFIAALTVVMLLGSIIWTQYIVTPTYDTFTTLMLGKPQDNATTGTQYSSQEITTNRMLISTYSELGKSKSIVNKVNRALGGGYTYNELKSKVAIDLVNGTELIKINVTDTDPIRAAKIANTYAQIFMADVTQIMRIDNMNIIDVAEIPDSPTNPKPLMTASICVVLGLMLGVFIAFLIEMLDMTIKSPEDVEKHLGLPVLGVIAIIKE